MSLPYGIGLPMWGQVSWRGSFFAPHTQANEFLHAYSQCFNTVEGNTSFYALPKADVVTSWLEQLNGCDDFSFVFKFSKQISHEKKLRHCDAELNAFFQCFSPLENYLGPLWLQLPASFSPDDMPVLEQFLKRLPSDFNYIVEVRHPDFFDRGEADQSLLNCLHQLKVDKVCFDSRALFACRQDTPVVLEAKRKKPNLPVRPVATGQYPVARFMGQPDVQANQEYLSPWVEQIARWIEAGKYPFIFLHTPSNQAAPELAKAFHQRLQQRLPNLADLQAFPAQAISIDQMGLF